MRWQPTGLWRNPDFVRLWAGRAISAMGSRITREGLPLTAVLVLAATPQQMSLLVVIGTVSVLLVGLFAEVWVDRRRRPARPVAYRAPDRRGGADRRADCLLRRGRPIVSAPAGLARASGRGQQQAGGQRRDSRDRRAGAGGHAGATGDGAYRHRARRA